MPQISNQKKDKISEQILHYLFTISPSAVHTNAVANEIARDEEFIKVILQDLEQKKLVISIDKNTKGITYTKRRRWRLSNEAHSAYLKHQSPNPIFHQQLQQAPQIQFKLPTS